MGMANEKDQSKVAYGDGPKEKNVKRRMPDGDKQFGKEDKTMPQDDKKMAKPHKRMAKKAHHRHKEHR